MRNYTVNYKGFQFKRISKREAAKVYKDGKTVIMTPVKMNPFFGWTRYTLNRKNREEFCVDEIGIMNDFNSLVSSYEYYNCTGETGRYAAFYIPVQTGTVGRENLNAETDGTIFCNNEFKQVA